MAGRAAAVDDGHHGRSSEDGGQAESGENMRLGWNTIQEWLGVEAIDVC